MNMGKPRPDWDSWGRRRIVVCGESVADKYVFIDEITTFGFASFDDAYAIAILSVVKAHQSRAVHLIQPL